jgi:hypothetical protein
MSLRKRKYWPALIAVTAVLAGLVVWLCLKSDPQKSSLVKSDDPQKRGRISLVDRMRMKRQLNAIMHALTKTARKRVRVSGTVREVGTNEPVAEAEVVFAGADGDSISVADGKGKYSVALVPGAYRAFARANGYVAVGWSALEDLEEDRPVQSIGAPRLDLAPVVSVSNDQDGIDIQLRGAGTIQGRVLDVSGWPVSGAIIAARPAGRYAARLRTVAGYDTVRSGADGSFELGVPAGPVVLSARHDYFAGISRDSRSKLYISPGDTQSVDLTLTDGCIISGRVVDLKGDPVDHGALEIGTDREPPYDFEPVAMFTDGEFRLARTVPGTVRLRAWPWKSPPAPAQDFACSDGARYTGITFTIPNAAADLDGTLSSHDGEPMAGARLYVFPLEPGGMAQREQTDADGRWAVFSMPRGRYLVSAHVPKYGVAFSVVSVPSRGIDLVLSGVGSISGTIEGMENGSFTFLPTSCLADADDAVFPFPLGIETSRDIRLVAVAQGRFNIDDLPACRLQGAVELDSFDREVEIDIQTDQTASLDIDSTPPHDHMDDWF